jgi:uncharacterized membrane protein SpoIIM required for sporulation
VIGEIILLIAIMIVAGCAGLWFGIVVVTPRLQRRIDRADGTEPDEAAKEPDGPAD